MVDVERFCEICGELKITVSRQLVFVEGVGVLKNVCIGCEEMMKAGSDDNLLEDE
ncbi:MAG: hypothetical protein O3A78_03375 [Nitrospinae bacterium]|jgi:hypothetical protein|nr:hypothetical protein [Nitrospinota bacterium]MDA1108849.1 hypothetical protein [Nitrospinota bacterium]